MLQEHTYGTLDDGTDITLFTLAGGGLQAELINYGASLVSLKTPDRDGNTADITLGWDTLEEWITNACYFGATVGRYANRIAGGRFSLDGREYALAVNEGVNHLHGGERGFDKVPWESKTFESPDARGVRFTYTSPDGEEGYPGTLDVSVTYTLTDTGVLKIAYEARTDTATVVNLTHHTYWNLATPSSGSILDHELQINASRYLPVDAAAIPTGTVAPVDGTPMDFRTPAAIGERIDAVDGGYDHNWCLDAPGDGHLHPAATLRHPGSGRIMEVETTEPGIQFYAGNFLGGERGKGGISYPRRSGLCLETQKWPDAPNHPAFPSATLGPGETYTHTCVYRFLT